MLRPMLSTKFQRAAVNDAIGMVNHCFDIGVNVLPGIRPNLSTVRAGLKGIERYHEQCSETFEDMCAHYSGVVMAGPFIELLESEHKILGILTPEIDMALQYLGNLNGSADDLKKVNALNFQGARDYLDNDFMAIVAAIEQSTEDFKSAVVKCREAMDSLYDQMEAVAEWQNEIILGDIDREIAYSQSVEGTPYQTVVAKNAAMISSLASFSIGAMMQVHEIQNQANRLSSAYTELAVGCAGYFGENKALVASLTSAAPNP